MFIRKVFGGQEEQDNFLEPLLKSKPLIEK
jgi:hypothetical protein